ncbi:MAG: spondin domain-containing protein [Pseudomonadota bacterium]
MKLKHSLWVSAGAAALLTASAASATTLSITFENVNGAGFLVTPVYAGFHDGGFDAFDAGSAASEGVEQVAELPIPPNLDGRGNLLAAERRANQDGDGVDSQGTFIANGGPIADGGSATVEVDIADPTVNRYASFLAMVVPSNDTFFGNDNPLAYELFDAMGNLTTSMIEITAGSIYDAGTEINDFATSTQAMILKGADEGGVITSIFDEDAAGNNGLENLATLFGLGDVSSITRDTVFFRIGVEEVAPVPLPASAPLLLGALGLAGWGVRRRQKQA